MRNTLGIVTDLSVQGAMGPRLCSGATIREELGKLENAEKKVKRQMWRRSRSGHTSAETLRLHIAQGCKKHGD